MEWKIDISWNLIPAMAMADENVHYVCDVMCNGKNVFEYGF